MRSSEQQGNKRVLVVDDEPSIRDTLGMLFRREGYQVSTAPGCKSAIEQIRQVRMPFPVVLTDLRMPDGDGFEVLDAAKERSVATEVLVMTAYHEHAYDAMRRGAYDFVSKPFPSMREVLERVGKAAEKALLKAENEKLRKEVAGDDEAHVPWVAGSPAMKTVLQVVQKVAPGRTTVLITGESGTGKERIARLLHDQSPRQERPFAVVNCGALPEDLMESELFGHEKGSFTGASSKHLGVLRSAHGGTLLLDEVGELPMSLQVKLLRVLQEGKVRPVGASFEQPVDVRILAATNADVEQLVEQGGFRRDLYYRLNVIRLEIPALRQRMEDLPMLVEVFVRKFAKDQGKTLKGLTKKAYLALEAYSFPGNVRELENIIERGVVLADGEWIGLEDLPPSIVVSGTGKVDGRIPLPEGGCQLDEVLQNVEEGLIRQALQRTRGRRKAAAELLGITFRSFRYRLAKLGWDTTEDE